MFTALGKELEDIIALQNNQSPGTYRIYRDNDSDINETSPAELPPEEPPKIFALIIGINRYLHPDNVLTGAVADADAIEQYIRSKFPSSEIRNLRDEGAKRSAIIQGIRDLGNDAQIRHKDPILIFYAGNGSEASVPESWALQGQRIQVLLPQDYNEDETLITDFAFGRLLEELATKKGDNIVVVLDCCHSGSMTRSDEEEPLSSGRSRSIKITKPLSENVDQDILGGESIRAAMAPKPFEYSSTSSHVLLAACGENELANEITLGVIGQQQRRGAFTLAFLDVMNRMDYRKLTYAGLVRHLPDLVELGHSMSPPSPVPEFPFGFPNRQTPRCEGANRDRFLFDPKPPLQGHTFHEAHVEGGRNIVVRAGAVHGVTLGAEFTLYPSADVTGTPIGTFGIRKIKATSSILEVAEIKLDRFPAFALQTRIRDEDALRVCLADKPGLHGLRNILIRDLDAENSTLERCIFVDKDRAQVEVDIEQDTLVFNIPNSPITALGPTRLPFRIKLGRRDLACNLACNVIRAAARFERYLGYSPEDHILRKLVEVEFLQVERKARQKWGPLPQSVNLCKNNFVEIVQGPTLYGIKVINNSLIPLYPHLFLFDCSDLSIESYYRPPTVQKHEDESAPLQPNDFITIGFGSSDQNPWDHYVRDEDELAKGKIIQEEQDLDFGIFKLFLTRSPVDLSFIAQRTPFSDEFRDVNDSMSIEGDEWDTISIVVMVKRDGGTLDWAGFAKSLEFSSSSSSTS